MKHNRFALIGAAGYIAPRHMKAIKDVGGELVAVLDPSDSIGIIDSYFPDCKYFKDLERFWRQLDKWRYKKNGIDYLSICSPNYLHDAHCMLGLNIGANVICEKPLVIKTKNLERLQQLEQSTNNKIYTILQLRYHPEVLKLKEKIQKSPSRIWEVDIDYITPRGRWYELSWKGDIIKSGGILYNIGIHLFDIMIFLFGKYIYGIIDTYKENHMSTGTIQLERAVINWNLSIDMNSKPRRSIIIDGEELNLNVGFTDLYTIVYSEIISGRGYGIEDVKPSIQLVEDLYGQ